MTFRPACRALLVAGILLVAAGMVLCVLKSSQESGQQRTERIAASQRADKQLGSKEPTKSFSQRIMSWWSGSDDIVWLTGWLVIFSALLVVVSAIQIRVLRSTDETASRAADAARDSAKAQESQLRVQRAYVFIDLFEVNTLSSHVVVLPKWRNSGSTPTRFMTNWVNWKPFAQEPPQDYDFPDLDGAGNPVSDKDKKVVPSFVGPQATTFAEPLYIPAAVFADARDGKVSIFIWGWTKYEDIFGTPHITKFCNKMRIVLLDSDGKLKSNVISFPLYSRHNCTDEECVNQ